MLLGCSVVGPIKRNRIYSATGNPIYLRIRGEIIRWACRRQRFTMEELYDVINDSYEGNENQIAHRIARKLIAEWDMLDGEK